MNAQQARELRHTAIQAKSKTINESIKIMAERGYDYAAFDFKIAPETIQELIANGFTVVVSDTHTRISW